jgi:hypothetical protein
MTSQKIPKELEGIAHYTYKGTLVYKSCIDCGAEKKRAADRPRCRSCAMKLQAIDRDQIDKWNPREGFRICKTCKEEKPLTLEHFQSTGKNSRGSGFSGSCSKCRSKRRNKKYAEDPEYRERKRKQREKYLENNPDYWKRRYEKRRSTPEGRLRHNVSGLIRHGLRRAEGSKKGASILAHLPYTIAELRQHIESQFEAGMSWENWGKGEGCWNIDHIYPHSKLPYDSLEHPNFQKAWALENLRPLWEAENIRKKDKIIKELIDPDLFP